MAYVDLFPDQWARFWMRFAGPHAVGRVASRLAGYFHPPIFGLVPLASMHARGYISPEASIHHDQFVAGPNVFLGERVRILKRSGGGAVQFGKEVHLYGDTYIQTGQGGTVTVGDNTHIQQRCYFSVFMGAIRIGKRVEIAPSCAFYAHNHCMEPGELIMNQPLMSKGGASVGDGAWLGHGVVVLDGAHIGAGAVVGAGSVVSRSIPDNAIAVGTPARVIRMRGAEGSQKRGGS